MSGGEPRCSLRCDVMSPPRSPRGGPPTSAILLAPTSHLQRATRTLFWVILASLMPLTPVQIKDKLTNALDDDKNQVVDEKAVEEVITLLETCNITKEILEQTRLGRDINTVRKICRNPALARRAKNLVKAWKKLIIVPGSPQVVNGQHPTQRISPGLPAFSSRCLPSPALVQTKQQQNLKVLSSNSPVIQVRGGQPLLPPSKLSHQDVKPRTSEVVRSPKVGQLQRNASLNVHEDSNLSWPGTPPSHTSENSSDRLLGDTKVLDSSAADKNCPTGTSKRHFNFDNRSSDSSTESTSKPVNRASDQRDVSKTNVANRKRTRTGVLEDYSHSSPHAPCKQPHRVSSSSSLSAFGKNDVINGSIVRKTGVKSPGFHVSHAGLSSTIGPVSLVSSLSKSSVKDQHDVSLSKSSVKDQHDVSLSKSSVQDQHDISLSKSSVQDQYDASSLPNRINQRPVPLRPDSIDSRQTAPSESRGFKEKLGKVKTTEQLIEDMQRKSATPVGTSVIAQIRTNQIEKESDSQRTSLPHGVKARGRKKKQKLELLDSEAGSEGGRLAQAKSEYIERFLQTSVAPTPGEDVFEQHMSHLCQESLEEQPISLAGCHPTFVQPVYESRQDKSDSGPSASPPEARDILEGSGHLPSATAAVLYDSSTPTLDHLSEEQLLVRLPPVDFDNIDWTSHDYPPPQPVQVCDALVELLHHGNLDGINGTYDRDGQFRRWQEMITLDSNNDEPLYILPYVILD